MIDHSEGRQRRISQDRENMIARKFGLNTATESMKISAGDLELETTAQIYTWELSTEDLVNVLRAHIHAVLPGLSSNHFVHIQPTRADEGEFAGMKFKIICPEKLV